MNDLIRSEWRRFRRLALVVAVLHGLALVLLSRAADVPQLGYEDQGMLLAIYMLLGMALALLQVGSYRQPSRWLWLIHRPLAPGRIFTALAVSALAQLGLAIALPLLVFLVATDVLTTQVVDVRHYVALVHALAFALMAWLAGAHACTSRHKAAVVVLLAPLLLALHLASVWWLLVPVLACLAWLFLVARHGFRADRHAPIARHGVLLLTALPLQLGFFLLVFQVGKAGVALAELLGRSSPGRTVLASDPDIDVDAMLLGMSQDFLAKGLEHSRDPRVPAWLAQLPLLQVAGLSPDIERFPVRHQLGNLAPSWWDDERGIQWTFSHDRMQFHGRIPASGEERGWWGPGGLGVPGRFADVPAFGMTRDVLHAIDHKAQRQHELVRLPAGEWFVGRPVHALDRVLLLTNRRLLAYRPDRQALSAFAPPQLDWQVPLAEDELAPLVDVFELLDGWLVSLFYFDAREFDGFASLAEPWQHVVHIDGEGRATLVGERRGIRGQQVSLGASVAVPAASWWVSPPLYALARLPGLLLESGLTQPPRLELLPRVRRFQQLALACQLVALLAGWLWLRGTPVSRSRRALWLASCAVLGLPAFLSLVCLEPRRSPPSGPPRARAWGIAPGSA